MSIFYYNSDGGFSSVGTASASVSMSQTIAVVPSKPLEQPYHQLDLGALEPIVVALVATFCVYLAVKVRIDIAHQTLRPVR